MSHAVRRRSIRWWHANHVGAHYAKAQVGMAIAFSLNVVEGAQSGLLAEKALRQIATLAAHVRQQLR